MPDERDVKRRTLNLLTRSDDIDDLVYPLLEPPYRLVEEHAPSTSTPSISDFRVPGAEREGLTGR